MTGWCALLKQNCLITKVTILFGSGKQIITQTEIIKLGVEKFKMVILTLDVPKEWVLWSDISYWCCAMGDSSMYFHQADKPALEEWYTYMDKEYGIIFDFDYLLSHPDWYLDKEDSLEKQGVIGKIPFPS